MIRSLSIFVSSCTLLALSSCNPTSTASLKDGPLEPGESVEYSRDKVIRAEGNLVYIACFYGDRDHDQVAQNECTRKFNTCTQTYGANSCRRLDNPSQETVSQMEQAGVVVVVTHSTPGGAEADATGVNIWNSQANVTPKFIADSTTAPVVWHGCYGASVGQTCSNVLPLQDTPQVLDTREPIVDCRFQATILCVEKYNKLNKPYSQLQVESCIKSRVATMRNCR